MFFLLTLFTLICKPGIIYTYGDTKEYQDLPSLELNGESSKDFYYYEEVELENGVYLYISNQKDSVWFYIEQEAYLPDNQEFLEIK